MTDLRRCIAIAATISLLTASTYAQRPLQVYVLVGQSNMQGLSLIHISEPTRRI